MIQKIINVAVIAHVDTGKSTLVDALLKQTGVFRDNEEVGTQIMDSNDLERERGITIYSKNCSIKYKDVKINIVDTPGHADFTSEVERIMKTVDTVILLVDSVDGPMPQTRVVLENALNHGLNPILFINKIDKKEARVEEVINDTFDLFLDLDANDRQLDFPICYGIARDGIAIRNLHDDGKSIEPLLDIILEHVKPFEGDAEDALQMQISQLDYDNYIGRLGVGRVNKGSVKAGDNIVLSKRNGELARHKITRLFVNEGLRKVEVEEAFYGDIAVVAGIPDISIGETICNPEEVIPMPMINIEEPTLSMNFLVNDSPFAGKTGKFVTSRHIKERLDKELETNVGLRVEEIPGVEGYKVSGRGELHLSILIEKVRREGYELAISKPTVLYKKDGDKLLEPYEKVVITLPDEYSGGIINALNERKGEMQAMESIGGYTRLEYLAPTRSLIGYRMEFVNATRGEGTLIRTFEKFGENVGKLKGRKNGVLIASESGKTMAYSLFNLQYRGRLIVEPSVDVYEGMLVGINKKSDDLTVNPNKNKKLTNTRSSASDKAIVLEPKKVFTLEEALEFIEDDELVEVTPVDIRLRKKILSGKDRYRENK